MANKRPVGFLSGQGLSMGLDDGGPGPQGFNFVLKVAEGVRSIITVGVVGAPVHGLIIVTLVVSGLIGGWSVRSRCRCIWSWGWAIWGRSGLVNRGRSVRSGGSIRGRMIGADSSQNGGQNANYGLHVPKIIVGKTFHAQYAYQSAIKLSHSMM